MRGRVAQLRRIDLVSWGTFQAEPSKGSGLGLGRNVRLTESLISGFPRDAEAIEGVALSGDQKTARGYAPTGKNTGIVKSKGHGAPAPVGGQRPIAREQARLAEGPLAGRAELPAAEEADAGSAAALGLRGGGLPEHWECWEAGTATFLILGDVCTRACKYCAIAHGMPTELDWDEPRRVAEAVAELGARARRHHEREP